MTAAKLRLEAAFKTTAPASQAWSLRALLSQQLSRPFQASIRTPVAHQMMNTVLLMTKTQLMQPVDR